jgi:hypothetical protein
VLHDEGGVTGGIVMVQDPIVPPFLAAFPGEWRPSNMSELLSKMWNSPFTLQGQTSAPSLLIGSAVTSTRLNSGNFLTLLRVEIQKRQYQEILDKFICYIDITNYHYHTSRIDL